MYEPIIVEIIGNKNENLNFPFSFMKINRNINWYLFIDFNFIGDKYWYKWDDKQIGNYYI